MLNLRVKVASKLTDSSEQSVILRPSGAKLSQSVWVRWYPTSYCVVGPIFISKGGSHDVMTMTSDKTVAVKLPTGKGAKKEKQRKIVYELFHLHVQCTYTKKHVQ